MGDTEKRIMMDVVEHRVWTPSMEEEKGGEGYDDNS